MQKRKILRKFTKANQAYIYLLRSLPEGSVREVRPFSGRGTRTPEALTHAIWRQKKPMNKSGREVTMLQKSIAPVGTRIDAFTHALYAKRFLDISYLHPSRKKALCGSFSITETVKRLERRLDTLVYKAGFARTIAEGKQRINHQKIVLNHTRINLPSCLLQPGDRFTDPQAVARFPRTHVLEVDGDTAIYLFHPHQAEFADIN